MNKSKKQSPKNSPVKLNEKDLKEVNGGYGNYGTTPTNPGGIALN